MKSAINVYLTSEKESGRGKSALSRERIYTVAVACFFIVCAVAFPKTVSGAALASMERFAFAALPIMLPFAVASGLLLKSGFGEICERIMEKPFRTIFGMSGALSAPFALGALAGFPIGARSVCESYRRGECSSIETEEALALCSNPGFGFTVAGVGGALWNDIGFGAAAWGACVLSSMIVATLCKRRRENLFRGSALSRDGVSPSCSGDVDVTTDGGVGFSVSQAVAESVREGAGAMLTVSAFVVVFNVIPAVFTELGVRLAWGKIIDPTLADALLSSFFEFSSGVTRLGGSELFGARFLTVATLAWSGISVHMQVAEAAARYGLSVKRYWRRKAASAIVAPILFFLLYCLPQALAVSS